MNYLNKKGDVMIIYKNTFDNVMTIGFDFPIEDQYYANENEVIVADGITRDPIGISDFSKCTRQEFLEKYPRPSGAELAAKEVCNTFLKATGSLVDRLIEANRSVKRLNEKCINECDYLENDYYGTVASCVSIEDNILNYAYICDCGVIVYDKNGNVKFKTEDDKELYSDPYIIKIGIPWNLPAARKIVRSEYRNNLNNIVDGKCVSYGTLTGEETAISFIRSGQLKLEDKDIIIVYSDGFSYYLTDKDFINNLINFNKDSFEKYIEEKSKEDYERYGKEKTLVIFKK